MGAWSWWERSETPDGGGDGDDGVWSLVGVARSTPVGYQVVGAGLLGVRRWSHSFLFSLCLGTTTSSAS